MSFSGGDHNKKMLPHESFVLGSTINTLSILDGPFKHVTEFSLGAKIVGSHKINHTPVFDQIILQRVTG